MADKEDITRLNYYVPIVRGHEHLMIQGPKPGDLCTIDINGELTPMYLIAIMEVEKQKWKDLPSPNRS